MDRSGVCERASSGHASVKGLGELGIIGTAAAVANAIYHAIGKRVLSLPIRIHKLLEIGADA